MSRYLGKKCADNQLVGFKCAKVVSEHALAYAGDVALYLVEAPRAIEQALDDEYLPFVADKRERCGHGTGR